jgi:uncharacterized protein (TIRG00374 family)
MARGDLLLLIGLSFPCYVLSVWSRALRWRYLTNPIAPIPRGTLFRAQAIGFMVNNLVPLRIGELVRSWYLARETRTSGAAILGTVILERALDIVSLLLLAAAALALLETGSGESRLLATGAKLLIPVALAPLAGLIVVRVAPSRVLSVAALLVRPLPERLGERLLGMLQRFSNGLEALSGGTHLFWIVFHSVIIWLVWSTIPVLAAALAYDLDLGTPFQMIVASWILLGAVGVAVAIPSAPGFFGPYQLAFKEVLERFGVDPATALGMGLVVWVVFWASLTLLGLAVMRLSRASLAELTRQSGKDPTAEDR